MNNGMYGQKGHWDVWEHALLGDTLPMIQNATLVTWYGFYPELVALRGIEQNPLYHPEGDVLIHTFLTVEEMTDICSREDVWRERRIILMLAALCHDLGKAVEGTTRRIDGSVVSYGHAQDGVKPTLSLLERLGAPQRYYGPVCTLVREHMAHHGVQTLTKRAVRRLARRLEAGKVTIKDWALLLEADASGRSPLPESNPGAEWVKMAEELGLPQPLS